MTKFNDLSICIVEQLALQFYSIEILYSAETLEIQELCFMPIINNRVELK
jgi:hypothetical protein